MQHFVAIGKVCFKPGHFKFWSNFEFDRNIVSGTGARSLKEHYIPCRPTYLPTRIWGNGFADMVGLGWYFCETITKHNTEGSLLDGGVTLTAFSPNELSQWFIFAGETILFRIWPTLCQKWNHGSTSTVWRRRSMSDTNYTAGPSPWTHYPRSDNLKKTHLGNSPNVVKHPPDSTWNKL